MRASDYELLYDLPSGEYDGRGIGGVRTTTVRAGRSLEVMCYPRIMWSRETRREAKRRRTSAAMERINARNRERHHMRLVEENFTEAAYVATLTYPYPQEEYGMCKLEELTDTYLKRRLPWEMDGAKRDWMNFISRLRYRVKKLTGDAGDLKWDVVLEEGKKPPVAGLPRKYHFHAVIEAPGLARDMIEQTWGHGHTTIEHLNLKDDGAMRIARYLNKGSKGSRWWSHSRNLRVPTPTISDRKVSRRRLALLAADIMRNGRDILERLYPGYKVVELPDVRYSDFVSGCYIYARMRRRD